MTEALQKVAPTAARVERVRKHLVAVMDELDTLDSTKGTSIATSLIHGEVALRRWVAALAERNGR